MVSHSMLSLLSKKLFQIQHLKNPSMMMSLKLNPMSQVLIDITLGDFIISIPPFVLKENINDLHIITTYYTALQVIQIGLFTFVSFSTLNYQFITPVLVTESPLNFSVSPLLKNCVCLVSFISISNYHCLQQFKSNFFNQALFCYLK